MNKFIAIFKFFFPPTIDKAFIVTAYKNGELLYKERFVNEEFTVTPGDEFDKVEIIND